MSSNILVSCDTPAIPTSILRAQQRAESAKREANARLLELQRQAPVKEAYRNIYEEPRFVIGHDTIDDDAWRSGYAKRLTHFGKVASEGGYAESILKLTVDNCPFASKP